jgi:hypothetical protein
MHRAMLRCTAAAHLSAADFKCSLLSGSPRALRAAMLVALPFYLRRNRRQRRRANSERISIIE